MNSLVLTTLPHYLIAYESPDNLYASIVILSTTLSALWHSNVFPRYEKELAIIDHIVAGIWFLADVSYAWHSHIYTIATLDILVCLMNFCVYPLTRVTDSTYDELHSAWHIVSVFKGFYVAVLLSQMNRLEGCY